MHSYNTKNPQNLEEHKNPMQELRQINKQIFLLEFEKETEETKERLEKLYNRKRQLCALLSPYNR